MGKHVFISYQRESEGFVKLLMERIEAADLDSWSDRKIRPSEYWEQQIDNAIRDAYVVIVVLTPQAKVSEYVIYEWSYAMGLGIPILPIILESTELHPKLKGIQYFDFIERFQEPWDELIALLSDLKNPLKYVVYMPQFLDDAAAQSTMQRIHDQLNDQVDVQSYTALEDILKADPEANAVVALVDSKEKEKQFWQAMESVGAKLEAKSIPIVIYAPDYRLNQFSKTQAFENIRLASLPKTLIDGVLDAIN